MIAAGSTYETLFSNTGRNTFRGPLQSRWDTGLMKTTRMGERFRLAWRVDFFNVLNYPDFDVPCVSTGLCSTTKSGLKITGIRIRDSKTTTLGLIQQTVGCPRILQLSAAVSLLLTLFFTLIVRAYARGEEINCRCFGPGEAISWKTLLRDGSMLAGSLALTWISFRKTPPPAAAGLARAAADTASPVVAPDPRP